MTVWAVLDKDGKVLVLATTAALAHKLADPAAGATVEEMWVIDGR